MECTLSPIEIACVASALASLPIATLFSSNALALEPTAPAFSFALALGPTATPYAFAFDFPPKATPNSLDCALSPIEIESYPEASAFPFSSQLPPAVALLCPAATLAASIGITYDTFMKLI